MQTHRTVGRSGWLLGVLLVTCSSAQAQPPWAQGPRPGEEAEPKVPGFGPVEGTRPIPGFGLDAETPATLLPEDFTRADERLQRYDSNRDGYLDRNEARQGRWYDDPYVYDQNRDNRLSRTELAHRYAQRRLREAAAGSGSNPQYGSQPPMTDEQRREQERRERERREQERREQERRAAEEAARRREGWQGTRASWYLAETLMSRHDKNRDGTLDANERRSMGVESAAADTDHDFRISRPELAAWLAQQEAEQNRAVPRELPTWFVERDSDKDGQISMKEFTDEWTDEKLDEFIALDTNNDGFIVTEECLRALERSLQQHVNRRFQVIPTKGVIRSEIEIEEHARIADVDVMISITHTHDDHLNAFLIGPEGQRVELFTGVGGQDDHFDNTILDEESPTPIVRARPPFAGRFQTEELVKGRPGLKQFYEHSMAGTWTLLIEANSDRPGELHSWGLTFRKMADEAPPAPQEEFD